MINFPNCKINLGLRILRKRTDGYHDLETVFYPLPFYDALEILPSADAVRLTSSGLLIEGPPAANLCIKAYDLVKKDFPSLPAAQIYLHKTIPAGAGLGGGSADAAFMLLLLNKTFQLGLEQADLLRYALQLGSDCPFFIINKPCFATGRGETLTPVSLDLSRWQFILVNPGIAVHTGQAFSRVSPGMPVKSTQEIIQQPIETWRDELINDFETSVFEQHPDIHAIKKELYNAGAVYASLSGSGSTVYGIFEKTIPVTFSFPSAYFIKQLAGEA